ncbi:MAG: RNA-binding transcriptional accessory protein [Bacteroidales bacterium]|nr:RNA-binding transcriptional accessory protein [Bacteroidales bacterium]
MDKTIVTIIRKELLINEIQVQNTIKLFDDGCTIPFISRYRKEATGSLDEVQIGLIKERYEQLTELLKRKISILKTIEEQGKLTDELKLKIEQCFDSTQLEDLYLPYKVKRRTKATIAREKGLEPLATDIFAQKAGSVELLAEKFLNDSVASIDEALEGARHIIAEWINENVSARTIVRESFANSAVLATTVVKTKALEAEKYKDYFDFRENLNKCPSHRIHAMMRGANEGFLRLSIKPNEEQTIIKLNKQLLKGFNPASEQVKLAVEDSYQRLIEPSIETEFYNHYKEKADEEAIKVFTENLRQLLLLPPLGAKRILAIDPGFRTGCKLVCLNEQGVLLYNETIYPHPPQQDALKAIKKIEQLSATYKIEAIAIGNGTASRETEQLFKKVRFSSDVKVFIVNEAGASVYSASKIAREELPEYDVTVRGAVSIGRRLADPLAELVKIDPKSIGVGQYQHDVDQNKLQKSLDITVESCVNLVGVEVNTASKHILNYISGLGKTLAENIILYRAEHGNFTSRKDLMSVPKMGKKTFEQCAGFIRISNAKNPLDNSAVHPESYHIVEKMAKDLGTSVDDLLSDAQKRALIKPDKYISDSIGMPTIIDILAELDKPGRDPRSAISLFEFAEIKDINALNIGMVVPGIVSNITNFGAFVDIGIKENGLIHISNICKDFITNPNEVLKLNQQVKVKILEVDIDRKRIQLSMKDVNQS